MPNGMAIAGDDTWRSVSFVLGSWLAVLGAGLTCYPAFPLPLPSAPGAMVSAPVFLLSAIVLWRGKATAVNVLLVLIPAAILLLQAVLGFWFAAGAVRCSSHALDCRIIGLWAAYLMLTGGGLFVLMGITVGREDQPRGHGNVTPPGL